MNAEGSRMDLVDGHVNVFVVFVVVAGGDVLVLRKPQGVDEVFHNMPELLPIEASVFWMKRNDEVIGSVVGCPRILRLNGLDQSTG